MWWNYNFEYVYYMKTKNNLTLLYFFAQEKDELEETSASAPRLAVNLKPVSRKASDPPANKQQGES